MDTTAFAMQNDDIRREPLLDQREQLDAASRLGNRVGQDRYAARGLRQ